MDAHAKACGYRAQPANQLLASTRHFSLIARLCFPLLAAVCLTVTTGCAVIPAQESVGRVGARPPELRQYYSYAPITVPASIKRDRDRGEYWLRLVELTPPPETLATNLVTQPPPIQILWYEPKTMSRAPLVLISPISGSNTLFVDGFAEAFVRGGYHAAIVKRLPIRFDSNGPLAQVEDYLRTAITRQRQALDWLLTQPNVDTNRVASFGISYGAILNAATAGVDSRLRVNIFALAGAPLPDVIETSAERSLRRFWAGLRDAHHLTNEQLTDALRETIRSDPIRLAPYIDRENVLMVIALFDRSVGTVNSIRLWKALAEPNVAFVPFGHYTAILAMPSLQFTAMHYLHDKLAPPPPPGNAGWLYRAP